MPKKRDEYHRQIKKIAVQVLQDEWELSFTEILATRLFGDRAAWRVEEKSPVISLAIVVTGGPEAQRPAQNQQRRRKLPPALTRSSLLLTGVAVSACSLAAGSFLSRANALLAAYPGAASAEALSAVAPREHLLLDFGWKFQFGHGSDPARDLGFGSTQGDFAKSGEFKFATEKFDDSRLRALNLPHDWAVELPFVRDESLQGHGYKPLGRSYPETSVGWYRRAFDIPESDRGRRLVLDFDGAFRDALVFVNGYFLGRNNNGYAPFRFDFSDFANYGGKNYVVVRMDASFGDGWFYEGAGIYRHVWLTKTDALHLGQFDRYC